MDIAVTDERAVVPAQQQGLALHVVEMEPGAGGDGPTDTDWHNAQTQNWLDDPERKRINAVGVRAFRAGNMAIWVACGCAFKLVGRYARGATMAFASDIVRSVDTVENMAHAVALYRRLMREFRGVSEDGQLPLEWTPPELYVLVPKLRALRRRLYYSHFAEMWSLWRQNPRMTALEVYSDLETAAENGAGSRTLKDSVGGDQQKTAYVATVYRSFNDYVREVVADDDSEQTYVVILRGAEWDGVEQVKVRPA